MRESLRRLERLPDGQSVLTRVFYDEMFKLAPEARAMFPEDISAQEDRLLGALLAAAGAMDDHPEQVEQALRRWGVIHRRKYGVQDEQYVYIGQALVRALTKLLTNDDSMMMSSWVAVYYWMAAVMIDGANQADLIDQNPALLLGQRSQPVTPAPMATVHPIRSRVPTAPTRHRRVN